MQALIKEIDLDRGSPDKNHYRDIEVYKLIRTLSLPPTLLCQELDKQSSPERKISLMFVLRNVHEPEVVQALLRQLGDCRVAAAPTQIGLDVAVHPRPYRVRDQAFLPLISNVDPPTSLRTFNYISGDKHRDQIIQEGLATLGLTPP